jgi:hypothetical protein
MENQQEATVLTTREWVITLLIRIIPVVGFIMLFVWAFGNQENQNKANWAKASLILIAIGLVLVTFCMILFGGTIAALIMSRNGENIDI